MADAAQAALIGDLVAEVLGRRGQVCFTVTSSSMEPTLRPEDRVEVRGLAPGGPDLGEVVLFRDPVLGHVVHRVVWRWPLWGAARTVYTKGDAIAYRDPGVAREQVLGRVVRVRRGEEIFEESRLARRARVFRAAADMIGHRLWNRPRGEEAARRAAGGDQGDEVLPSRAGRTIDAPGPRP